MPFDPNRLKNTVVEDIPKFDENKLKSTPVFDPNKLKSSKESFKPLFTPTVNEPGSLSRAVDVVGTQFVNTALFGVPEYLANKAGRSFVVKPERGEEIGAGLGSLGGFISTPAKVGAKIASKLPLVSRAFRPASNITQAIVKPLIRQASTLGVASALQTPETAQETGFISPKERGEQLVEGAKIGTEYGVIGFIPNKTLRMIATSLVSGVPSTLQKEPLEKQVFEYGVGAFFGREGATPKQLLAKEKPLATAIKYGEKTDLYLNKNNEIFKGLDEYKEVYPESISRKDRFDKIVKSGEVSSLLELAQKPIGQKENLKLRKDYIRNVFNKIKLLKTNPDFIMSFDDADFLVNYIEKESNMKTIKNLSKMDSVKLKSLSNFFDTYQPQSTKIFTSQPPMRPEYGKGVGDIVNLWDISLRPRLFKLKKMGFDYPWEEGYGKETYVSGINKEKFNQKFSDLEANWIRTAGTDKGVAKDLFQYLDGKISDKYIISLYGEKTLDVAKQIRKWWDWGLDIQNRHRSYYGEEPIKGLENYATHTFDGIAKEYQRNKYPIPEDIELAMQWITPKEKTSPYFKERTGATGYVENVWKALESYNNYLVQVINDNPIRKGNKIIRALEKQVNIEKQTGNISGVDYPKIIDSVRKHIEDLQQRPGSLDIIARNTFAPINRYLATLPNQPQISLSNLTDNIISLLYGTQLSYRVKPVIRNLFQQSLVIGQTGFKPLSWAIKQNKNSPEIQKILSKSDILSTRPTAFAPELKQKERNIGEKFFNLGLLPYKQADRLNVENAYLSGYKLAKDKGMSDTEAYKYGEKTAILTQFVYLPENRNDFARFWGLSRNAGKLMSMFTSFPSNWVEFNIASAYDKDTQKNLLKYWATAIGASAVLTGLGVRGAEYFGITSPRDLFNLFGRGEIPTLEILKKPQFRAVSELNKLSEGDSDLKDILFYTIKK